VTFLDRVLVVVAVLAGIVLAQGRLRGSPVAPAKCTDECQEVNRYYDCVKKQAYEFLYPDCYPCANGRCKERTNMPGGYCKQTDCPRKFRYLKDYTLACDCDSVNIITRVEIDGGTNTTEWDQFDTDFVWVCKPAGTGELGVVDPPLPPPPPP